MTVAAYPLVAVRGSMPCAAPETARGNVARRRSRRKPQRPFYNAFDLFSDAADGFRFKTHNRLAIKASPESLEERLKHDAPALAVLALGFALVSVMPAYVSPQIVKAFRAPSQLLKKPPHYNGFYSPNRD